MADKHDFRLSLEEVELEDAMQKDHHLTEHDKDAKIDAGLHSSANKHPKAIYFILANEVGERFCYNAVSPNVNKYFMQTIGLDRYAAKALATTFVMLVYCFPLLVFSIPNLLGPMKGGLAFLPFVVIALGSGGIKPCVSSHGGDQYLPSQEKAKEKFFSLFYALMNLGSLVSLSVVPAIANMSCMGLETCYTFAFSVPTIIFFLALVLFAAGYRWYRIVPPLGESLPWKVIKAVALARSRYSKATPEERAAKGHWLNFAEDKYGGVFLNECRDLGLSLALILIPCSFCKMLYLQNSSEWATQYYQMNGALFGPNSKIMAAQVLNFHTLLVVSQLSLWNYVLYPFFERRGRGLRPTTRMIAGYFFTILAFVVSAILSKHVEEAFLRSGRDPTRLADYDGTYCETCVSGWAQVPQWLLLSLGECLFIPTGYHIMYNENGRQFRALSTSLWLMASSLGAVWVNLLDPVMVRSGMSTWVRNLTYSGIATAGMILFTIGARIYVPRKERPEINQAAHEAKAAEYRLSNQ
ncbi:hypothetical protein DFQ27_007395 [Actinomortierella ambigua]|uniref:Uncharacterized protein n=1 Tax=Actinomortierella ambigua TaxID=1343610 RepID=A0A9P6QHK4_9FUNG|nr:hypothetical protein DFQ27_007395 [Actinomortierella ambigua]